MPIASIAIGERVRKDLGDIQALASSIARHGLLHPVVVTKAGLLVAGHRRIEAARALGWTEIAATVVDVQDLLAAERDENDKRKDFTPTEAVAIGRLIEATEKPQALERERKGRPSEKFTEGTGRTRDIVARAVGMSGPTYENAKAVVEAAVRDPQRFGDLPRRMDETGKVDPAYRTLRSRGGVEPKRARRGFRSDKDAPYDPKTERQKKVALGQKERMTNSLSTINGLCIGLGELDVQMARSVSTASEINQWCSKARALAKQLRVFAARLERTSRR